MLKPLAPVLIPIKVAIMEAFFRLATLGLHPLHPDHGAIALRRARLRGGVRVR